MALSIDYPKRTLKIKVSADAEKFMCDALLDQNQPVSERFRALSIRRIRGSASRNALIRAMRDDSSLLAYCAAHELGVMRESEAIPAFEEVLCDLSLHPIVRHKAAEALSPFGLKSNVAILMNCLVSDPAQEVRETCEVVLTRIGELKNLSSERDFSSFPKLREFLLDEGNTIYERLEALSEIRELVDAEEAVSAIIESLAAKSPILRHRVVCVLSQLDNKKATDALSNVLQDPCEHPLVRQEAAKAFGSIADDHCILLLKEFANDPEPIVSQSCEVTLKRLDFKRLGKCYELVFYPERPEDSNKLTVTAEEEKFLCDVLLDRQLPIWKRSRALSLYRLSGPAPRNALIEAMRDASALLAYQAAYMLGLNRDRESIPALEAVLNDLSLHPIVRHKAAEVLGIYGSESNVPALESSLASDPSPEVRETCEVALGRIADLNASPLLASLGHSYQPALPYAGDSIPILREVLLDENRGLYERHSALFRLKMFPVLRSDIRKEVVPVLIESLRATSPLLRCWVAKVLSTFGKKIAADALLKLLDDPSEHVMVRQQAAECLGNFINKRSSEHPKVGQEGAEFLDNSTEVDPRCKLLLERIAATDPEPIVSQSCQVALKMLEKGGTFELASIIHMDKWTPSIMISTLWAEKCKLISC